MQSAVTALDEEIRLARTHLLRGMQGPWPNRPGRGGGIGKTGRTGDQGRRDRSRSLRHFKRCRIRLRHLVRNAVAHGIPDAGGASGGRAAGNGSILVSAAMRGTGWRFVSKTTAAA